MDGFMGSNWIKLKRRKVLHKVARNDGMLCLLESFCALMKRRKI
jgi:hypothetical protein